MTPHAPPRQSPDEARIEQLLESARPSPSADFHRRMRAAPWHSGSTPEARGGRWPRVWQLPWLEALLVAVVVLLTPPGQDFARSALGRVRETQSAAPVTAVATPRPPLVVNPTPPTPPTPTATPWPSEPDNGAPSPSRDPYYPLSLLEAEERAGFEVLQPAYLPMGFSFQGAAYSAELRSVTLSYRNTLGPRAGRISLLVIQQREVDLARCPSCAAAPESAVERIRIGGFTAEYAEGGWQPAAQATPVPGSDSAQALVWVPTPGIRTISWTDDGMRHVVVSIGPLPDGDLPGNLGQATLLAVAESMIALNCDDALLSLSYRCQVARAEAAVGFDAKEPPGDLEGLVFASASGNPVLKSILLKYTAIGGGTEFTLWQARGESVASSWNEPPAESVERVTVGGNSGEYVRGYYVNRPGLSSTVWDPTAPVRQLRWREGDTLFEMQMMGHTGPAEWLEKDTMVELAASLVYTPDRRATSP